MKRSYQTKMLPTELQFPFAARLTLCLVSMLVLTMTNWESQALANGGAESSQPEHLKYEAPGTLTATIWTLDRKQMLFKLTRKVTRTGSQLDVSRDYTYPDGKLAAREMVVYKAEHLVSFALDDLQSGAHGT